MAAPAIHASCAPSCGLGIVVHMAAEVPTYHVPKEKVDMLRGMMSETVEGLEGG